MTKLLHWTASGLIAGLLSSTASAQQAKHLVLVRGQTKTVELQGAEAAAGSANWAALQGIQAAQNRKSTQITISLSASVTPRVSKLTDPDRVVLDFPGTISATPKNRISVNRNGITAIRVGVQASNPPTTRVVVDLAHAQPYSVLPRAHKVILKLGPNEGSSSGATADQEALLSQSDKSPAPGHQPEGAARSEPSALLSVASLKTPSVPGADVASDASQAAAPVSTGTKAAAQGRSSGSHSESPNAVHSVATNQQREDKDPSSSQTRVAGAPEGGTADPVISTPLSGTASGPTGTRILSVPSTEGKLALANSSQDPDESSAQPSEQTTSASATTGSGETNAHPRKDIDPGPGEQQVQQLSLDKSDSGSRNRAVSTVLPTISMVTPPADLANATQMANRDKQQPTPGDYVIGEQDELTITVWKERELSGIVTVRPDGKITLPLLNEIKVVGLTPLQLQDLLTEKFKPFLNIPQVTVSVRQINSRNVYLIGQVGREGMFPINSSTTVLQLIAEAGGLRDFAKRKGIYILRKEQGKQRRLPFNYDQVIRGKNGQENVVLQPGDTIVVP